MLINAIVLQNQVGVKGIVALLSEQTSHLEDEFYDESDYCIVEMERLEFEEIGQ